MSKKKIVQLSFVFDGWRENGKSIYSTEKGFDLSIGDFHSGTTFEGQLILDEEQTEQLQEALDAGYQPVFWTTTKPSEVTKALKRLEKLRKSLKKVRTSKPVFFPDFSPSGGRYKKGFWNRLFGRVEDENE